MEWYADCIPSATQIISIQITQRDLEIMDGIDCHPLTANQLLKLSQMFESPFGHLRLMQRRLQKLSEAGYLNSWAYATTTSGCPHYYKLSRKGYRLLHGKDAILPGRRFFEAMAENHHYHTRALGDFLTHLFVTCHKNSVRIRHFSPENRLKIETGSGSLLPDAAFQLVTPDGKTFNYLIELDNGTERIRSTKAVESIERKIRGYDQHQGRFDSLDPQRYVVLFVMTRSSDRLQHIMQAVRQVMANPQRTVFLGTELQMFLNSDNPLEKQCLTDNRGRHRGIIPPLPRQQKTKPLMMPLSVKHRHKISLESASVQQAIAVASASCWKTRQNIEFRDSPNSCSPTPQICGLSQVSGWGLW